MTVNETRFTCEAYAFYSWVWGSVSIMLGLQRVQNYATRIVVTSLGRSEQITPVLHDLHWLPVDMRIVYTVLLYNIN